MEEIAAFLKTKCSQWSYTTHTQDTTPAKQNLVARPIVLQILYSTKGTDFDFCSTVRRSAEVFKQTQEKRKAHILLANVPHPKHNTERFFPFEEVESDPANVRNLWQCKILQTNHLSRPNKRRQVRTSQFKTMSYVPSPSNTERGTSTSISVPSYNI